MNQAAVEHRDPRELLDELAAIEAEIVEEVEALRASVGGAGYMRRWRKVPLGEAIELAYGKSLPKGTRVADGKVPVYGSNGIAGWHDVALVNESTVIVGRKGSAGAVQYVEVPCYPIDTTYFVRVRTGFEFDIKFLFYLLRQLDLSRLKTATGVPGLTREDAYRELIPVPPLAEQHRIVDILSRAEGIVRLRREAQKKAAEIIPALFVDMFGDPATNPKGWPIRDLGELITDGPQNGLYKHVSLYGEGTPILRIDAFYDGLVLSISGLKRVRVTPDEHQKFRLRARDMSLSTELIVQNILARVRSSLHLTRRLCSSRI